jgi:hypothetical protein
MKQAASGNPPSADSHYIFLGVLFIPKSGLKSKISYTPEDGHVGRNM